MSSNWLKEKINEGTQGIWKEVKDVRLMFSNGAPRLVDTEASQPVRDVDRDTGARKGLSNNEIVSYFQIEVRCKDTRSPRRIVSTWLAGYALARVITLQRPTRTDARMSHDKYQVMMQFLLREGVCVKRSNGYAWAEKYKAMPARADWLIETLRQRGKVRFSHEGRYVILD